MVVGWGGPGNIIKSGISLILNCRCKNAQRKVGERINKRVEKKTRKKHEPLSVGAGWRAETRKGPKSASQAKDPRVRYIISSASGLSSSSINTRRWYGGGGGGGGGTFYFAERQEYVTSGAQGPRSLGKKLEGGRH
jgi:hypothetical protein